MQQILLEIAIIDATILIQKRGVYIDKRNSVGVLGIVRHKGIEEAMLLAHMCSVLVKLNREDIYWAVRIVALETLDKQTIEVEELRGI